MYDTILTISDI